MDFTQSQKGFISLISAAFILGTFGVLIRTLAESFTDSGQVFARSLAATLIIVSILVVKKLTPFKVEKENIKYLIMFGVAFPLSIVLFTFSANTIKVTNSLFMLYVGGLLSTAILGKFVLKQELTLKHYISFALAILGLSFFVYPFDITSLSIGLVAGIFSGIFEGACHALRGLMKNVKREIIVFYQSLSGVILASLILFVSGDKIFTNFSSTGIIVALIFGALLVAIGYLLAYGFGNFDASLGTIILATELLFALIINTLILKEAPTSFEIIGGLLIFAGSIITSIDTSKFKLNTLFKKL